MFWRFNDRNDVTDSIKEEVESVIERESCSDTISKDKFVQDCKMNSYLKNNVYSVFIQEQESSENTIPPFYSNLI